MIFSNKPISSNSIEEAVVATVSVIDVNVVNDVGGGSIGLSNPVTRGSEFILV